MTENMNDKKLSIGSRVKHKDTGEKYIIYRAHDKCSYDISDDRYVYTMTTSGMFSSKYIEPLTEEEIMEDINNELSDLKVGDIITWKCNKDEDGFELRVRVLVLDVSENSITIVRLNSGVDAHISGVTGIYRNIIGPTYPPHEVWIENPSNPPVRMIDHKWLFARYEYDNMYRYEIGVPAIETDIQPTFNLESNVVAIDIFNCYSHMTGEIYRSRLLTIPRISIDECLCKKVIDGDPLSIRKMNIFVKEINAKVIYKYLISEDDRELKDINEELERQDNE